MKKLLVIGIVAVMVMTATSAFAGTFVKDTDWLVYMQAGNNTFNNTTQNWGSAGAEIKMGCASAPGTVAGGSYVSTSATVRDLSSSPGGYGLIGNTVAALDQTNVEQKQVWDNLKLWAGSGFGATALSLRIWGVGYDGTGASVKLEVTQAVAGSGFTVGQVIFDTADVAKNLLTNASKKTPSMTIDLTPYIATYKTGTADAPIATFKLTATTPAIPEPGSMVALFSGLVGLVGFGIRRRK